MLCTLNCHNTYAHLDSSFTIDASLPSLVSVVLQKYEDEFCEVIEAKCNLLKLVRKGVITQDIERRITASNDADGREILFDHLKHHSSVEALREYCKVAYKATGYPNMQKLAEKIMSELPQGGWFEISVYQCPVHVFSIHVAVYVHILYICWCDGLP